MAAVLLTHVNQLMAAALQLEEAAGRWQVRDILLLLLLLFAAAAAGAAVAATPVGSVC
jgi:hypothetical protein